MSETLMKLVVNCETGESSYEPLTEEELAQREADLEAYEARVAAEEAEAAEKAEAKAALLEKLGITEEEAKLLLS